MKQNPQFCMTSTYTYSDYALLRKFQQEWKKIADIFIEATIQRKLCNTLIYLKIYYFKVLDSGIGDVFPV